MNTKLNPTHYTSGNEIKELVAYRHDTRTTKEGFKWAKNAESYVVKRFQRNGWKLCKTKGVKCAKEKGSDIVARRSEIRMDIDTYKDLLGAIRS